MSKPYIFFGFVILVISYMSYNELTILDYFKQNEKINSSKSQDCKIIPSENPIETFIPLTNNLFIGGSTNYKERFRNLKYLNHIYEKGSIIVLDKNKEKIFDIEIENFPKNMPISPDGMDYYNGKLYVINHAYLEGERIEVFKVSLYPLKLIYEKTFKFDDKYFGKFNSITVINNDIFYVSEWLTIPLPLKKNISLIEKFLLKYYDFLKRALKLRFCAMIKFNMKSNTLEKIDNSYGIANNGITYDRENKLLYLAQTFDKNIKVFKLDEKGEVDKFLRNIPTEYGLDNLFYDNKTKLLYAAILGNLKISFDYYDPNKNVSRDKIYGGLLVYEPNKSDKVVYTFLQNDFMIEVTHGIIEDDNIYLSSACDNGILRCKKL